MRQFALTSALFLSLISLPAFSQESDKKEEKIIKAHGIGVFQDLKLAADFEHLAYVNPDAPKGGEIAQAIPNSSGFDNYNPFTIRGRAAALSSAMVETILIGTADEIGAAYCLLCESIEYPESRDWVIFNLRPEAKFSDGTALTADDVLFSHETFRDKGLTSYRLVAKQIFAGAEVLDDHRIKFTFTPDFSRRDVIQAAGGLKVFSRKDFEENDRDLERPMDKPLLGSGPYVFESANINRNIILRRDPNYWGRDLPINRGRHNFDRIRIEYFADYDAAFEAFKAGEYNFRREVSSIFWATRYDFPGIEKGWVVKELIPNGSIPQGQAWVFNLRRPILQDIRVRQAISMMFNFEWSNDSLFYDLYKRPSSFWENSDLAATGTPSPGELALLRPVAEHFPDGILTDEAVTSTVSGPRQLDRANLRKASALLNEAGWAVGPGGIRQNADGQQLELEILNDSPTFDRVTDPFVQNLRALGIDAKNARVDNAEFESRRRSHKFDMLVDHLGQKEIPGSGLQQYFGSGSTEDAFNVMGVANPGIDALIAQVEAAKTHDEMIVRTNALDRALRSLRFWVPQWYDADHKVAYYDMFRHPDNMPPYELGDLDFWWYDEARAEELRAAGALR